ncbi:MAG: radical SAM protein [Nanoarchaeota archaeon]
MIPQNRYFSYNQHTLPDGCQFCVKGEKMVLFATGLCPRKCYFCPVSDQKYGHDVSFANERKLSGQQDIIQEAEAMDAKGAGITGGDPLMKIDRTVAYIKQLKEKYGPKFHIHLYTSLNLVTEDNLKLLHDAGLDEIRFHLDLDSEQFWPRLELAKKFAWKKGVELPSIPEKEAQLRKILDFIHDKVDFLVLNELEVADNNMSKLLEMGYKTKEQFSYAVEESINTGLRLIEYAQSKGYVFAIHLCTAKLKDRVQLANRIKREAEHSKQPFDMVDEEGLLTRGALYSPSLVPGFKYREKLAAADKDRLNSELKPLLERLQKKLKLSPEQAIIDTQKCRILLAAKMMKAHRKEFHKLGLIPAIVKEYPTADQLEIEVELL